MQVDGDWLTWRICDTAKSRYGCGAIWTILACNFVILNTIKSVNTDITLLSCTKWWVHNYCVKHLNKTIISSFGTFAYVQLNNFNTVQLKLFNVMTTCVKCIGINVKSKTHSETKFTHFAFIQMVSTTMAYPVKTNPLPCVLLHQIWSYHTAKCWLSINIIQSLFILVVHIRIIQMVQQISTSMTPSKCSTSTIHYFLMN